MRGERNHLRQLSRRQRGGDNSELFAVLTVIYSADQDCSETESDEGNEEALDGVLDEPQGLSRVEKELDQERERVEEEEGDVDEEEHVLDVKKSV